MLTLGLAGTASAQTACNATVSPGESIQTDGLDQATPGDTVCVEAGDYQEEVTVDVENVTLTSLDEHGATIVNDPSNSTQVSTVDIRADDVTVEDFTIERIAPDDSHNRGLQATGATGVTVTNNVILGDDQGNNADKFVGVMAHDNHGFTEVALDGNSAEGFGYGYAVLAYDTNSLEADLVDNDASQNNHGFLAIERDGAAPIQAITGADNDFTGNANESIVLSEGDPLLGWNTQTVDTEKITFDGLIPVEEGDSVQLSIDLAAEGAHVQLLPGTYEERVVIDVDGLRLNSQNNLQATITYDPGIDTNEPTVDVRADDVSVTRLSIERVANETDTSSIRALQTTGTDGVTVSGNAITGLSNGTTPENFAGILVHEFQGNTNNVTLKDNSVEGFQHGIAVLGHQSNAIEVDLIGNAAQNNENGLALLERDGRTTHVGPVAGSANDFTGNHGESILLSEDGDTTLGWDMQDFDAELVELDGPILVEDGDSLQTANDVAADGATVNVGAGTYEESVLVNVPGLSLIGADGAQIVLDPATAASDDERALTLAADGALVDGVDVERVISSGGSWERAVQISPDQSGADSSVELRDLSVSITTDSGTVNGDAGSVVVSNPEASSFAVDATLTGVEVVSDATGGAAVAVNNHGPGATVAVEDSTLTDSHRGVLVVSGEATVEDTDLSGNDIGVENKAGTAIATKNWWGAPSGPFHVDDNPDADGVEAVGDVDFDPWWADEDMTVLATLDGDVTNEDQGATYDSIQGAVDNAGTGHTLTLANGTYAESVDLDVDGLTLTAEHEHQATITFAPSSATYQPSLAVSADDVTVDDLVIERHAADDRDLNTGSFARALEVSGSTGAEVVNNVIEGEPSDGNPPRFSGVQVVNSGAVEDVLLEDNEVEGFHSGIVIRGWDGSDAIREIHLQENEVTSSVHGLVAMQEENAQQPEAITGAGNGFTGNAAESIVLSPTSGVLGISTWSFNTGEIALDGPVLVDEGDTVATALDVIAEGGTVELSPGTYEETVELDVPGVTLTASQTHEATIKHAPSSVAGTPTVNVVASQATVEDLRIERVAADDRADTSAHAQALAVRTDNVTVAGNVIEGDLDTTNPFDRFDGVMVIDNADAHDIEIVDNRVEGFFAGIVVTSAYPGTTVENVEVSGNTATANEHGFVAKYHDAGSLAGTQPMNVFGTGNDFLGNDAENIYISTGGTFQGYDVADFDAREVSFAVETVEVGDNINMVLDVAAHGGILELEPGTHDQTDGVVIDKPTTLTSAEGAEETVLTFTEVSGTPTVSVEAESVDVTGLTIERGDSSSAIAQAVRVSSSDALLEDLILEKVGSGSNDQGVSVLDAYAGEKSPSLTENVEIDGVSAEGFATGIGVATQSAADVGLTGVSIENVELTDNTYGIGLAVAGSSVSPDQVRIEESSIEDNDHGVYLFGASEHSLFTADVTGEVTLRDNVVQGNTESGLTNLHGATVDARENYWGSPTGPDTDDDPSLGTGDAVQGEVEYEVWCVQAACYEHGAALLTVEASLVPTQDFDQSDDPETRFQCTSVRGYPGEYGVRVDDGVPSEEDTWKTAMCVVEALGHSQTPPVTTTVLDGTMTATTE